ncbi:hypothetical protein M9Y10_003175 [Tritrichomonas musculus]|uniref:Ankyrin repeat protein n=1 Tax=Tritrichomonas musculus TaxID=1915356 RepID=A0ABR2JNT3_9EUKA
MADVVLSLINHPKFDPDDSNLNLAFLISKDNQTILNYLYSNKSLDINYLEKCSIVHPFDSNTKISLIETNLTFAVRENQMIKFNLIISHPSFDPTKSHLNNALLPSISSSKTEITNKLLDHVQDVNIQFSNGKTLFYSFFEIQRYDVLIILISNQDFIIDNNFILFYFIQFLSSNNKFSLELLEKLVDYDEKHNHCIDFKNPFYQGHSFYCLIDTCNDKFVKIIQFLIDHNADPNQPDEMGRYQLEYALYIKSYSYVKALIDSKKIDFSIKIHGETYLHLAAKSSKKILKLILDQNLIDINTTDDSGDTPYATAMKRNHIHNAHLLERRANPNNKSNISSSNSDDYDEEDGEILSRILDLLIELDVSTKIYNNYTEMTTKLSDINKISERKKLIAEIQDLFNKANIFETPFNNNDDLSEINNLEFLYDNSIDNIIQSDNHDDFLLLKIQKLFNDIKKN